MSVLATDGFAGTGADLGANWTPVTGHSSWQRVSDAAAPSSLSSDCTERYSGISWPNDQYAQAKITAISGGDANDKGVGIALRCASGANTMYRFVGNANGAGNDSRVAKYVGGTYTSLSAFSVSPDWAVNDIIYAEIQGTTWIVKKNGTQVATGTDSAIASGDAGVDYSSTITDADLDDWEGGDFAAATTPKRRRIITLGTPGVLCLFAACWRRFRRMAMAG